MLINMFAFLSLLMLSVSASFSQSLKPNIILIFCDDLGYGDLGVYGSKLHRSPNLDQMAADGAHFTDFYVTSGVCTPSRASLLTGCYPRRVDMHVNARHRDSVGTQVLFPRAKKGLNPNEITLAELLKEQGYATTCIGKWHLGDQPEFLPTHQGFDYYFGIPYSNDMNRNYVPLPLMRDEKVIEAPVDQNTITRRYTEEAIRFMDEHQNESFFIYLPHAMTHNPLHASDNFRGKSANGIYGDAVEELDWSTGQILKYLRENNLEENTIVIFTSDNGAAPHWGGSNGKLRGWKGSTWEGGMRVPCLMQW
ncbi:MAG: sulfatase-like hydrolase/transferase, partial [Cyclobacteriaceae bacterium]